MTHYPYTITTERENEQYFAYSEELPGVYGVGWSIEEAKISILEAFRLRALWARNPIALKTER